MYMIHMSYYIFLFYFLIFFSFSLSPAGCLLPHCSPPDESPRSLLLLHAHCSRAPHPGPRARYSRPPPSSSTFRRRVLGIPTLLRPTLLALPILLWLVDLRILFSLGLLILADSVGSLLAHTLCQHSIVEPSLLVGEVEVSSSPVVACTMSKH